MTESDGSFPRVRINQWPVDVDVFVSVWMYTYDAIVFSKCWKASSDRRYRHTSTFC